jgi:deoxyribonuclease-4
MSIAGGLEKAFARGEEVGCEAMQIFTKSSNQWKAKELTDQDMDRWAAAMAASPITPVIAHDSYLINLASPTEELLVKSREAFLVEVERCERLAIPFLVMHPGAHRDAGEEQGLQTIAESFDWVHGQTHGFKVKVLLETTAGQGSSLGYSFAQLRRIIDMVEEGDRLGVCLDTCHVFAAGYDLTTQKGYEATFDELDKVIGLERLRAIHLNDSKKPLGSRVDRHEHIGLGALGLEPFRMLVNDPRLVEVPMILETPKGKDNAEDLDNLATLRGLLQSGASKC